MTLLAVKLMKKEMFLAAVELRITYLDEDHTEVFTLNGQIDEKIWGDSPREDFFRVYMLLAKESNPPSHIKRNLDFSPS